MNLRLFCALPVPSKVQDELMGTSTSLQSTLSSASISWVKRSNLHLTLSFLGDVEQTRIEELAVQLRAACEGINSFEVVCQGLGCFPNLNRPRVVWAGVRAVDAQLPLLQKRVATACAPFAQKKEKSDFSGHITLGRIRSITSPARANLTGEIERGRETVFGQWTATEVQLICSDLSQGPPRYSVLHHIPLLDEVQ